MNKERWEYVNKRRLELSCRHCGLKYVSYKLQPWAPIIWHHPNSDGDRGRVGRLIRTAGATIEDIDAEIARCVPLCYKCHAIEHVRMSKAALATIRQWIA